MDGSTTTEPLPQAVQPSRTRVADGFPGQRLRVLPRPLVARAIRHPPISHLMVTDAGFFPRASHHWRSRAAAEEHIVIHCAAGTGTVRIGDQSHAVESGQVVVIPAGTPHHYEAGNEHPWTIWWVHVIGSDSSELLRAIGASADQPVLSVADPAKVAGLIDDILRRMEKDETRSSVLAATGAAWHLLALLAADRREPGRPSADPIDGVLDHLRANMSESPSVTDLAAMAGYSTSHFSALFRRATGYGVVEYQTRLRMSQARELLTTTDRAIAQIAAQVGYADPMYFSRQFRRIHDASPSQYRERSQRNS